MRIKQLLIIVGLTVTLGFRDRGGYGTEQLHGHGIADHPSPRHPRLPHHFEHLGVMPDALRRDIRVYGHGHREQPIGHDNMESERRRRQSCVLPCVLHSGERFMHYPVPADRFRDCDDHGCIFGQHLQLCFRRLHLGRDKPQVWHYDERELQSRVPVSFQHAFRLYGYGHAVQRRVDSTHGHHHMDF